MVKPGRAPRCWGGQREEQARTSERVGRGGGLSPQPSAHLHEGGGQQGGCGGAAGARRIWAVRGDSLLPFRSSCPDPLSLVSVLPKCCCAASFSGWSFPPLVPLCCAPGDSEATSQSGHNFQEQLKCQGSAWRRANNTTAFKGGSQTDRTSNSSGKTFF